MVRDRNGSFQGIFFEYRAGGAPALIMQIKIGAGRFTRGAIGKWDVLCLKWLYFQDSSDVLHLVLNALAESLNVAFGTEAHIDVFSGKRNP
jgi:hypothetical protein